MIPYTRDAAEADLQEAMASGDLEAALAAAGHLDRLPGKPAPSLLGAALWYADQGLPVFPVQPGQKVPYKGTRGVKDATLDADRIRDWWGSGPGFAESNIGLATGHRFDVIDVDGLQGNITLARELLDAPTLDDPYNGLPPVWGVVSTPRPGGKHLYITATGRPNASHGDGIDYRGLGGYVLAPPSRTDLGAYQWLRPLDVEGAP